MTKKRFTNIEHDYENAWIKCNDDGDFMIYAIYKELDESLPSLEDLLNGLAEENEQLKKENTDLKEINQGNQDYISSLEEEKNNLQIKLQKIRDYAMEDGEVKQGVIEKVMWND